MSDSNEIKIIDIKDQAEGLKVQYEIGGTMMTLNAHEMPADTFVEALDALKQDVLRICHLQEGYDKNMIVTGIHLTRNNGEEGENIKAMIKAKKELPGGPPWPINTPNRCMQASKEGDSMLGEDTIKRIRDLCRQAVLYIQGNRTLRSLYAQTEIDFEAAETTEAPATKPAKKRQSA